MVILCSGQDSSEKSTNFQFFTFSIRRFQVSDRFFHAWPNMNSKLMSGNTLANSRHWSNVYYLVEFSQVKLRLDVYDLLHISASIIILTRRGLTFALLFQTSSGLSSCA